MYEKYFTNEAEAKAAAKAVKGKITKFWSIDENENPILIYCVKYRQLFQYQEPEKMKKGTKVYYNNILYAVWKKEGQFITIYRPEAAAPELTMIVTSIKAIKKA